MKNNWPPVRVYFISSQAATNVITLQVHVEMGPAVWLGVTL